MFSRVAVLLLFLSAAKISKAFLIIGLFEEIVKGNQRRCINLKNAGKNNVNVIKT
jgi:hypothetical protein